MEGQGATVATGLFAGIISGFQAGEIWMYAIGLAFVFSVAITLERFLQLKLLAVDGRSFMFEIQKYVLANDIEGAIRACNGASSTALSHVIKAGLQRAAREESQIQNAVDSASLEMIPKVERRLSYLAMIANVSTLLGLLGTITGLIRAFQSVKIADAAQRQAILSSGIAEAMNATAFGLMTAVFTMVVHSVLANRATRIVEDIDEYSVKLMDLLTARRGA